MTIPASSATRLIRSSETSSRNMRRIGGASFRDAAAISSGISCLKKARMMWPGA